MTHQTITVPVELLERILACGATEYERMADLRKDLRAAIQSAPAQAQQAQEPVELQGIEEARAEGKGFWASCTGCFETNEGHPPRGSYFSKVFHCHLGNGCQECGGIGAIWDTTDYGAMADAMSKDLDTHPAPKQAEPTWLPIDTAPKSNVMKPEHRLLLWIESAGIGFGHVYDDGCGGIMAVADGYSGNWNVTHWMPLPTPPEAK